MTEKKTKAVVNNDAKSAAFASKSLTVFAEADELAADFELLVHKDVLTLRDAEEAQRQALLAAQRCTDVAARLFTVIRHAKAKAEVAG